MSTNHMPDLPGRPAQPTSVPPSEQEGQAQQQPEQPPSLGEDMARVIEAQADIIAQRLVYHSQMMMGVGAVGADVVNARNTTLIVASALRNHADSLAEHSLINLGYPEIAQVNDQTLPFKTNSQVAGLLEGLLIDTLTKAYAGDAARLREATHLLDKIFERANEQMQNEPKALIEFQAPAPGPNARS